jgi:hypothetical protein
MEEIASVCRPRRRAPDGECLVCQRTIAPEEQPSVVAELLEMVAAPD